MDKQTVHFTKTLKEQLSSFTLDDDSENSMVPSSPSPLPTSHNCLRSLATETIFSNMPQCFLFMLESGVGFRNKRSKKLQVCNKRSDRKCGSTLKTRNRNRNGICHFVITDCHLTIYKYRADTLLLVSTVVMER